MRAIKIDPYKCNVRSIEVEPDTIARALGSEITDTIDFEQMHCLVIDDGDHHPDRPARFRFTNGPERPFFGPVLILGVEHGNWIPATLSPERLKARIIWEEWDSSTQQYAVSRPAKMAVPA